MLTMFILPSGAGNRDLNRTVQSIVSMDVETFIVRMKDSGIAYHVIETPFYGFIYDNEYFSESVIKALPNFLRAGYFDCLLFYKQVDKIETMFKATRIFKEHVRLDSGNGFLPKGRPDDYTWETLLDGYIKEDERT